MKKKIVMVLALLCMAFSLQAEVNKEEFFVRMTQKYSGVESISGTYEINMPVMGNIMKIPVNFWQKGKKMRMDMVINQPGMPQPMEQSILMDGEKIIQYQKMLNTVTTIDINKLPENMRQQGSMINTLNQLYQALDKVSIEEKSKGGKAFYLITINDIGSTANISSAMGMQTNQQMFKKMLMWIDSSSLLPEKIEIYGATDTPAMWIDILNIKTDGLSDSIFKLDIPADAKYIDMTDAVKKMSESMNIQ